MAFIPVPDVSMVELQFLWEGQQVENTLYFKGLVSPDVPEMNALGAELVDWWVDNFAAYTCNDAVLSNIKITNLQSVSAPVVEVTAGLPQAGTAGSNCSPNQLSPVVTFLTALRGKSYRGRNYIVGISEDSYAGSYLVPTYISYLETFYADLATRALALDWQWGVVSRYTGKAARATGVFTPITGTRVNPILGTQRRRRIGSGY